MYGLYSSKIEVWLDQWKRYIEENGGKLGGSPRLQFSYDDLSSCVVALGQLGILDDISNCDHLLLSEPKTAAEQLEDNEFNQRFKRTLPGHIGLMWSLENHIFHLSLLIFTQKNKTLLFASEDNVEKLSCVLMLRCTVSRWLPEAGYYLDDKNMLAGTLNGAFCYNRAWFAKHIFEFRDAVRDLNRVAQRINDTISREKFTSLINDPNFMAKVVWAHPGAVYGPLTLPLEKFFSDTMLHQSPDAIALIKDSPFPNTTVYVLNTLYDNKALFELNNIEAIVEMYKTVFAVVAPQKLRHSVDALVLLKQHDLMQYQYIALRAMFFCDWSAKALILLKKHDLLNSDNLNMCFPKDFGSNVGFDTLPLDTAKSLVILKEINFLNTISGEFILKIMSQCQFSSNRLHLATVASTLECNELFDLQNDEVLRLLELAGRQKIEHQQRFGEWVHTHEKQVNDYVTKMTMALMDQAPQLESEKSKIFNAKYPYAEAKKILSSLRASKKTLGQYAAGCPHRLFPAPATVAVGVAVTAVATIAVINLRS